MQRAVQSQRCRACQSVDSDMYGKSTFFKHLLQLVQIQKGKSNLTNSSSCVVRLRDPVLQKKQIIEICINKEQAIGKCIQVECWQTKDVDMKVDLAGWHWEKLLYCPRWHWSRPSSVDKNELEQQMLKTLKLAHILLHVYCYTSKSFRCYWNIPQRQKPCERHHVALGRQETHIIYIISSPAHDKYWQSWAKQGLTPLNEWTSRTAGWRTPWLFKQAWSEVPGCLMLLCFESAVWSMHISLLPSK